MIQENEGNRESFFKKKYFVLYAKSRSLIWCMRQEIDSGWNGLFNKEYTNLYENTSGYSDRSERAQHTPKMGLRDFAGVHPGRSTHHAGAETH